MIDYIINNIEWIFSGIGVVILAYFFPSNSTKNSSNWVKNFFKAQNNNVNTINIVTEVANKTPVLSQNKTAKSKSSLSILFIDDDFKFKVVDILKQSGWINTKKVKDIIDLDDMDAKFADVIFVDINGVGKKLFQDEGLGLAYALKNKYPEKKIILYSAESNGDRFHKAFRIIDDCLSKNAEPYEFINILETFISEN